MSKITVTTIAGATSGADANLVKIESGDTLQALSNATVGGTLGVTGATTTGNITTGNTSIITGGRFISSQTSNDPWLKGVNSSNTETSYIKKDGQIYSAFGISVGGTGAANTLDDYEEGTWTATLGGLSSNPTVSAYAYNSGHYTKIGRQVFAHIYMRIENGNISGGSGDATINGLPFAAKSSGQISNGAGAWIENYTSVANSFSSGRSYARPFMVNSENRMRINQLSYSNPTQMTGWSLTQADDGAFLIGGVMVYMTE